MKAEHPLRGRSAILATLHDKEPLVAPPFRELLAIDIRTIALDTDALGTFSGETPRPCSPLEAATAKARMAIEASGEGVGLGSEGIIGPHPDAPFVTCDTEIVACIVDDLGLVVHEIVTEVGIRAFIGDAAGDDVPFADLEQAGFPSHGLIVRPSDGFQPIFKGVHDREELGRAVAAARAASSTGIARVESDFRAHHHPGRRLVIARAARVLAERLSRTCPECRSPGWGRVDVLQGAPCSYCTHPTRLVKSELHGCAACGARVEIPLAGAAGVDPRHCPWCNP